MTNSLNNKPPFFWAVIIALAAMLAICFLSSCATQSRCERKYHCAHVVDSVKVDREIIVEKIVIDTFSIPADTAYTVAIVHCDSAGKASITGLQTHNGHRAHANASIIGNVISMGCECDSVGIYKTISTRSSTKTTQTSITKVVSVPVPAKITAWQKMKLNSWPWLLGIFIGFVLWNFGPTIFKFIRTLITGIP